MSIDWNCVIGVGGKAGSDYLAVKYPDHPKAWKNGYVYAHRVVMEQKLGRLLNDNEVVHHINGNKRDNSPENLEVLLNGQHSRLHRPEGRFYETKCAQCGKQICKPWNERPSSHGYTNGFCSSSCSGKFNGWQKGHLFWQQRNSP